jgi:putative radical SAM enzyme (TIGR03279 family)
VLATVHRVLPDSPAQQAGLSGGEQIVAINGDNTLEDLYDYQFACADETQLTLSLKVSSVGHGVAPQTLVIHKKPNQDAGIVFASPIFTPIKTCNNACSFCFIDQQPDGLRSSLYIKDDDYRLSALNNTYITLTNLTDRDRTRIARIRPGPFYISVHATDPDRRRILLKNPKAKPIMDELRWLKSLEIPFHCQIVVCPGINDGPILADTLANLATLRPEALSVAVVPLGLTQYRSDLPDLVAVDADCALSVIETVKAFNASQAMATAEAGEGDDTFVYVSDEFYFYAGLPLPKAQDYGDFPQLEDGVGTSQMLLSDFWAQEATLPKALPLPQAVMIVTGQLAAMALQPIVQRLNQIDGLFVDVLPVDSQFWGQSVHVAGLITGADCRLALQPLAQQGQLSRYAAIVIPSVMLKQGFLDPQQGEFLDGETVAGLSALLGIPIRVVLDPYSASSLVSAVMPNSVIG